MSFEEWYNGIWFENGELGFPDERQHVTMELFGILVRKAWYKGYDEGSKSMGRKVLELMGLCKVQPASTTDKDTL